MKCAASHDVSFSVLCFVCWFNFKFSHLSIYNVILNVCCRCISTFRQVTSTSFVRWAPTFFKIITDKFVRLSVCRISTSLMAPGSEISDPSIDLICPRNISLDRNPRVYRRFFKKIYHSGQLHLFQSNFQNCVLIKIRQILLFILRLYAWPWLWLQLLKNKNAKSFYSIGINTYELYFLKMFLFQLVS